MIQNKMIQFKAKGETWNEADKRNSDWKQVGIDEERRKILDIINFSLKTESLLSIEKRILNKLKQRIK